MLTFLRSCANAPYTFSIASRCGRAFQFRITRQWEPLAWVLNRSFPRLQPRWFPSTVELHPRALKHHQCRACSELTSNLLRPHALPRGLVSAPCSPCQRDFPTRRNRSAAIQYQHIRNARFACPVASTAQWRAPPVLQRRQKIAVRIPVFCQQLGEPHLLD